MTRPVRALIISDALLLRESLVQGLATEVQIQVVAGINSSGSIVEKVMKWQPDVLLLDAKIKHIRPDALLRQLRSRRLPVVMVSALQEKEMADTLDAVEAGAVDIAVKSGANGIKKEKEMLTAMKNKIMIAACARISDRLDKRRDDRKCKPDEGKAMLKCTGKVIAIGAANGGMTAIHVILEDFPANMPGMVIAQHMPAGFTRLFAERLNKRVALQVKEAESGDRITAGRVLIAPGGKHMRVIRQGGQHRVSIFTPAVANGCCPSIDVLFKSVAENYGPHAVGVILTGVGRDGAEGMKWMRDKGANCIAQDQATSLDFSMPQAAYAGGGAKRLVSLPNISAAIIGFLKHRGQTGG